MPGLADLYVYPGHALKVVADRTTGGADELTLEGPLVVFGDASKADRSAARDFFNEQTDYGVLSDRGSVVLPAYFDHGLDPMFKRVRIGTLEAKTDGPRIFAQYVIRKRADYLRQVFDDAGADDVLGQSSGAVAHLVDRKAVGSAHHVTAWPLGEGSLTPTPAEPRTFAALKSAGYGDRILRLDAYKALRYGEAEEAPDFDPIKALQALRFDFTTAAALRDLRLSL